MSEASKSKSIYNNQDNKGNQLILTYNFQHIDQNKNIQIFSTDFVKENLSNYSLIIDNEKVPFTPYYKYSPLKEYNKKTFQVILIPEKLITDMNSMFYDCSSLVSISDGSLWDTSNVTTMRSLFNGCKSLVSLDSISKWDTSNVTNMDAMFYGCQLLPSIPDISGWNTSKVISMNFMFKNCMSIITLPDVFQWDTQKVKSMRGMFEGCSSLIYLPDMKKFNIGNVYETGLISFFRGCNNLPKSFISEKFFY